ncbi:MAG: hypothetical protein A2Z52_00955 [Candidatus Moranbacteria bacterium RBG_19FT_COMBO_42_6]|nr:MAG: hypothetical protein A2Z52_00955 [Candidatus Moranbacteria bacterium RBG_19FT_COMBO_42_6]
MKFFRKLFLLFLVSAFIFVFWIVMPKKSQPQVRKYIPAARPCRTPLKYAIDSADPRFNISPEKLRDVLEAAENLWEIKSGLNLFEYDPEAELKVRLVFDERQQQTYEAEQLEASLKNLDTQKASLEKQQSALSGEYDKKLTSFKKEVEKYEKDLKEYNEEVSDWNNQKRTSEEEYNKLKKEEQNLKDQFNKLKKAEAELNAIAKKANTVITQENKIINSYNSAVNTYKSKFGSSQEFEKGIFDPSAGIIIYQFKETSDLALTLIHEFGHALGIEHVENPKSIMYYMIGEQNLDNPALTAEDAAGLKSACQL